MEDDEIIKKLDAFNDKVTIFIQALYIMNQQQPKLLNYGKPLIVSSFF